MKCYIEFTDSRGLIKIGKEFEGENITDAIKKAEKYIDLQHKDFSTVFLNEGLIPDKFKIKTVTVLNNIIY